MSSGQVYGDTVTRSVTMDSNLSAKEMFAVNLDTTDDDNVNLASGTGAFPFLLIDGKDGSSAKVNGTIGLSGRSKAKLGGGVNPGDKLTSDGSAKWIATTSANAHYGAVALQGGSTDDVIEVNLERGMVASS